MKCELCHNADAQRAIRKRVNHEEHELYVCHACAEEQTAPPQMSSHPTAVLSEPPPDVMEVIKETLPEIMGMILGAAVEFSGRIPSAKEPTCPLCGLSRSEYKKAARLGCAQCYEAFAKDLDGLMGEMHRVPRHTGKAPKHPKPSPHVSLLLKQLRSVRKAGNPAEADALQARIRQLGWEPEAPQEIA